MSKRSFFQSEIVKSSKLPEDLPCPLQSKRINDNLFFFAYYLTKEFFKHCTKNKILNKKINFNKPVILIHGNKDNIVKDTMPIKIMKKLISKNVQIKFLKSSDHSLSSATDLINIKNS